MMGIPKPVWWPFILFGFCLLIPSRSYAGRLREIEEEVARDSDSKRKGGYYPFYGDPGRPSGRFLYSDSGLNLAFGTPSPAADYYTLLDSFPGVAGLDGSWNISASFNYLYDVQGDLEGYGMESRVRTPYGTLHGDFVRFREETDSGYDYLNLYYLSYSVSVYLSNAIIDIGFGYAGLKGRDYHNGGGLYIGGEFLLFDPVVLDANLRYSSIRSTNVGDFRAGLVFNFSGVMFRAGYRYLQFEGAPDIRGPEAGVGIRF